MCFTCTYCSTEREDRIMLSFSLYSMFKKSTVDLFKKINVRIYFNLIIILKGYKRIS